MTGTVVSFNDENGYGFICPSGQQPERGKDIYVHATALKSRSIGLHAGDSVMFHLADCADGRKRAADVTVLRRGAGHLIK